MCFSIPLQILEIEKNKAMLEGGKVAKIDSSLNVKKGDYLQVTGDIVAGSLSKQEGLKIRSLIKKINQNL